MAKSFSGTSRTKGGSEERLICDRYRTRRRFKARCWGELRDKLDLQGQVETQVLAAVTKKRAEFGKLKLQLQSDGGVCVFTDV